MRHDLIKACFKHGLQGKASTCYLALIKGPPKDQGNYRDKRTGGAEGPIRDPSKIRGGKEPGGPAQRMIWN